MLVTKLAQPGRDCFPAYRTRRRGGIDRDERKLIVVGTIYHELLRSSFYSFRCFTELVAIRQDADSEEEAPLVFRAQTRKPFRVRVAQLQMGHHGLLRSLLGCALHNL